MDKKNNKIIHNIIEVLKNSFAVFLIIIGTILFILSLGLTSIFLDSYDYDYKDDWDMMDEWENEKMFVDDFHLIQGGENVNYQLDIKHKKRRRNK